MRNFFKSLVKGAAMALTAMAVLYAGIGLLVVFAATGFGVF